MADGFHFTVYRFLILIHFANFLRPVKNRGYFYELCLHLYVDKFSEKIKPT